MSLTEVQKEGIAAYAQAERGCQSSYALNELLWSLDMDQLPMAAELARELGRPIDSELDTHHLSFREQYPDPFEAIGDIEELCRVYPHAARPLASKAQSHLYTLLDYTAWVNADVVVVLQVLEEIYRGLEAGGDQGFAFMNRSDTDHHAWPPHGVGRNRQCFIWESLSHYSQYAPSTCRRVFLAGVHCSSGGFYHYRRTGPRITEAGNFTFWGRTSEAHKAAARRQSDLSHRIWQGGYE